MSTCLYESASLVPAFLETVLSLLQQISHSPLHCIPLYLPISATLPCGLRRESNSTCVRVHDAKGICYAVEICFSPNHVYRDKDRSVNLKIKLFVVCDYSIGFLSELLLLPAL